MILDSQGIMMVVNLENISSLSKLTEYVKSILSKSSRTVKLIKELEKFLDYQDVLFYTWKILVKTLGRNNESCDTYILNVLELLDKISVNRIFGKEKQEKIERCELVGLHRDPQNFVLDKDLLKKFVQKVWHLLINRDISYVVHRKLLIVLLESYLSTLEYPIFLTDFFMASLNMKGVVRVLALQGVATLMQRHNIEYPNIYGKLYSLFEPHIFHTKYKSRLFYLANIFLSSTHLPESLVASFAKRAARLSLTCATPDVLIILRFVGNILMRHTGLVKLIHHPSIVEVTEDPFLENEMDPMKTRASESSLWELLLLNNHCQPTISSAAKFIYFKLPSLEYDLNEVLNNSYANMFESECKKTKKIKPSLTFERPEGSVVRLKDDHLFKMWSLTI